MSLPDVFIPFARECGISDIERFCKKCEILHEFLVQYNTNVNLTRLTSAEDFYFKHAADSLSILRFFPELLTEKLSVADIGCGAGFPSLILALACPQLKISAIDSIGKKIKFVSEAAALLKLENINAVCGRSVELNCKKEFQHRFDIVTARAVAPSPKICKEAAKFPKTAGRFIFYKTPAQAAEEAPLLAAMKQLQWYNTPEFQLPCGAGERLFTVGKYR